MQCPTDGTVLTMSERSGIEIDYCPACRGVWLDRGELDKILDRASAQPVAQQAPQAVAQQAPQSVAQTAPAPAYATSRRQHDAGQQGYRKPRRKESWLSELFE
jgi:Zn-finger nucleic acid-binding protein